MVYRQNNYTSTMSSTTTMSGLKRKLDDEDGLIPNHILLFTILNPIYPITVEVLHKICVSFGQILRIVIFKKNGVQAMVEFDSVDAAIATKDSLNGADIYSDCCTLKIEFAKPERLVVHKNDSLTWDFTIAHNLNESKSKPLLQKPPLPARMSIPSGYGPPPPKFPLLNSNRNHFDDGFHGSPVGYNDFSNTDMRRKIQPNSPISHSPGFFDSENGYDMVPYGQLQSGSVLMVYGLDPVHANADKVFNLMCLYGNVLRVKFLKSKEGTAMVQMGDNLSAERCLQNLNNTICSSFGGADNSSNQEFKIQLAISKQHYLSEVTNPYPLPDKSPSFKDFSKNKNNRFLTPNASSKNRIQQPCKIIHFFNTPPNVTNEQLLAVFSEYSVVPPNKIQKIPSKSEKSSSGFMEFSCLGEAVAAIVTCNHAAIHSSESKFPFILKLCFSSIKTGIPNGRLASKTENNGIES